MADEDPGPAGVAASVFLLPLFLWCCASFLASPWLLSCTFNCNELTHARVTGFSTLPQLETRGGHPEYCNVSWQAAEWNDSVAMECSSIAVCEVSLAACADLRIAFNHYHHSRCLSIIWEDGDLNVLSEMSHESLDWWNHLGAFLLGFWLWGCLLGFIAHVAMLLILVFVRELVCKVYGDDAAFMETSFPPTLRGAVAAHNAPNAA